MRTAAGIAFIVLLAVWAGIVLGVSMLATPVKFQASGLSMPVALDIGRYTFRLLARVELCCLIGAIVLIGFARPPSWSVALLAVVIGVLIIDRVWLLPVLDARVEAILRGEIVPPAIYHTIFGALECIKSVLLIGAAVIEARSISR